MTGKSTSEIASQVQMRLAHLGMIQGIILRISGFSAASKNFCITIIAAIIAVAFQKQLPELIWAGVGVVVMFALLDTYYLTIERNFRHLYEACAARPIADAGDLSLEAPPLSLRQFVQGLHSASVAFFYALLLVVVIALLYVAGHVRTETERPVHCTCVADVDRGGSSSALAADRSADAAHAATGNGKSVPSGAGTGAPPTGNAAGH